jgi:penicillin-binding protein 1A
MIFKEDTMSEKSMPIWEKFKTKLSAMKEQMKKNKKNRKAGKKKHKSPLMNIIHGFFSLTSNVVLLVLLLVFIGGAVVCDKILDIVEEIPEIDPTTIEESLTENSVIVDKNGNVLETLFDGTAGRRNKIEFEEIGQNMIDAIIAIEDKTFYEHKGFNYVRLIGSAVESFRSGSDAVGTSTISQQLAKNLYLSSDKSMERKIEEAYYAILLEQNLTKDQIIWAYLNKIAFGMNTYGVQSASMLYFSKDAKDLNLVESVILAGIPKSPAAYAPIARLEKNNVNETHIILDDSDPEYSLVFNSKSQERFEFVLKQMYNNNMITEDEYLLRNEDIRSYINPTIDQNNAISSYFGDMVKDEAVTLLAEANDVTREQAEQMIYNRGSIIESTIDFNLQKKIEDIYNATLFTETFDGATYTAVKRFQENNSLTVDGVAGENTLANIVEQTSFTTDDFTLSFYKQGMEHPEISNLKKALDELSLLSSEGLFPRPSVIFNADGNIINDVTKKVLLYQRDQLINENQQLIIASDSYYYNNNDDLVILQDKGFNFYLRDDGIQVVMTDMFLYDVGSEQAEYIDGQKYSKISGLYTYQGQDVMIPREFTSRVDGNLVINKSMFIQNPNFFSKDTEGNLLVEPYNYYFVERGVIQPQSAFVLMDHHNGEIKAVIGGRDSEGQNIFNRALQPQQPGSSIKPIGPYTTAIKSGNYTAATVIDDVPSFLDDKAPERRWPYNWYENYSFKYKGRQNLRQGIEDSINVLAVKLTQMIGVEPIVENLKSFGISSIVETGPSNDMNLASLSLGGMTRGISPLELTAAYATFANQGVYQKPITVSRIMDLSGNVLVENTPKKSVVISEQVAYIIQDMMISAVTTGVSNKANFPGMTVAGKTGTTSDKRDAIFVGYTPYYTAGVWFGNDIKLKMDDGSGAAAKFWSTVMSEIHKDLEDIGFVRPEGIQEVSVDRVSGKRPGELSAFDPAGSQVYRELFLPGTAPTEVDDAHEKVEICLDNDLHRLANQYCENTAEVVLRTRLEPYEDIGILTEDYRLTVPAKECEIHTSETLENDGKAEQVIQTFSGGVILFIRDYNLLLESGEFVFIPKDSRVLIDQTIVLPNGDEILSEQYNVLYITKPETQIEEIYRRTQEAQEEAEESDEPVEDPNPDDDVDTP